MKITVLDNLIGTCLVNKNVLQVYAALNGLLKAAPPMVHLWETEDPLKEELPSVPCQWPDTNMCLCVVPSITPGYYTFCIDQGTSNIVLEQWIGKQYWSLEGILVYPYDENTFDVIPLAKQVVGGDAVMPEIQLHYVLTPDGWVWKKANTGQINAYFHSPMINIVEDKELVEDNIAQLGSVISRCLSTYLKYIDQSGQWKIQLPKEPKYVKSKILKPGSVGYKQFIPKGTV